MIKLKLFNLLKTAAAVKDVMKFSRCISQNSFKTTGVENILLDEQTEEKNVQKF